jgi:hypothetical protein
MQLACGLCRLVLTLAPADRPIPLAGDDTVESHPGRKVFHGRGGARGSTDNINYINLICKNVLIVRVAPVARALRCRATGHSSRQGVIIPR